MVLQPLRSHQFVVQHRACGSAASHLWREGEEEQHCTLSRVNKGIVVLVKAEGGMMKSRAICPTNTTNLRVAK